MGRFISYLAVVLVLVTYSCNSNINDLPSPGMTKPGNFEWAKIGNVGGEGHSATVDNFNNCFVTGFFDQQGIILDSIKINSNEFFGSFLAKYNLNGGILWAIGGDNSKTSYYKVISDNVGNLYVGGNFLKGAKMRFGKILEHDASLLKLSNDGNLIWTIQFSTPVYDMCIDKNGNVYAISSTINKISSDGNILYTTDSNNSNYSVSAMAVSNTGELWITGRIYTGSTTFGNIKLTTTSNKDLYIAKFNASGNCTWAKNYGYGINKDDSGGSAVALDASGNIYLLGFFENSYTIEGYHLSAGNNYLTLFLASYKSDGNIRWVKNLLCSPSSGGTLKIDKQNNLYISSGYNGMLDLDPISFTPNNNALFIAKLDSTGKGIWIENAFCVSPAFVKDLCIDSDGNCLITGQEQNGIDFGKISFHNTGLNYFLAKLNAH
jgi:hypothetical protein